MARIRTNNSKTRTHVLSQSPYLRRHESDPGPNMIPREDIREESESVSTPMTEMGTPLSEYSIDNDYGEDNRPIQWISDITTSEVHPLVQGAKRDVFVCHAFPERTLVSNLCCIRIMEIRQFVDSPGRVYKVNPGLTDQYYGEMSNYRIRFLQAVKIQTRKFFSDQVSRNGNLTGRDGMPFFQYIRTKGRQVNIGYLREDYDDCNGLFTSDLYRTVYVTVYLNATAHESRLEIEDTNSNTMCLLLVALLYVLKVPLLNGGEQTQPSRTSALPTFSHGSEYHMLYHRLLTSTDRTLFEALNHGRLIDWETEVKKFKDYLESSKQITKKVRAVSNSELNDLFG
ncbi:hypothetical protein BC941DRAFT_477523 [Chlamydoabsidia padenii]|nr:hypothetical protein BC941DRAFT_477523 [Chlamydoabsidia padenii]